MSYESNKNAHLYRHLGAFFIRQMNLAGCQINPIYVNFHLQESLEIFDKNCQNLIKKRQGGGKCPPLCQLGLKLNVV